MVTTLLNGHTILDQHVPAAEESPSTTNLTGSMKESGFSHSNAPSPYSQIDPSLPKASMRKSTESRNQVSFVGSEHWEAILEDITELKIDLETPDTPNSVHFKPQILFGMNHASRSEIVSSTPPRPVCDMLISRWFRTMDTAPSKYISHTVGR